MSKKVETLLTSDDVYHLLEVAYEIGKKGAEIRAFRRWVNRNLDEKSIIISQDDMTSRMFFSYIEKIKAKALKK